MVRQIWEAMQCISKSVAALEQKISIINFDMELMKGNVSKACDLFSLMENAPSASLPSGNELNEWLPPMSRTILVNSAGNDEHTPATLELQNTVVSTSIGSKSVSTYHTSQSRRSETPNDELGTTPTSPSMHIVPGRRHSPQSNGPQNFLCRTTGHL